MKVIPKTKTCDNTISVEIPIYVVEVQQSNDTKIRIENSAKEEQTRKPALKKLNTESSIPNNEDPKKELAFLKLNDVLSSSEIEEQNNTITIKITNEKKLFLEDEPTFFSTIIGKFQLPNDPPDKTSQMMRSNELEEIFLCKCTDKPRIKYLFLSLCGFMLSIFGTIFITTWPQHDIMKEQDYWYECMIAVMLSWTPLAAANIVNTFLFPMGIKGTNSNFTGCAVYILGAFCVAFVSLTCYALWVKVGGLLLPMPFQGYIPGAVAWEIMPFLLWCVLPLNWKFDKATKKKILFSYMLFNAMHLAELAYKGVLAGFNLSPTYLEWIFVIILFLLQKGHSWTLSQIGNKIAGFNDCSIDTISIHYAALRHIMFLSVNLGSMISQSTSYLILGVEFAMNLFRAISIIRMDRNDSQKSQKRKIDLLSEVIINESTELMMPLFYSVCMIMAYIGPNSEMIGNIGNSSWHFSAIENIHENLLWILIIFSVDLGSCLLTFILIWWFTKMNIFKMYLQMQKLMWYTLAIHQGYMVSEVDFLKYIFHAIKVINIFIYHL